jgi:hypothetical protein
MIVGALVLSNRAILESIKILLLMELSRNFGGLRRKICSVNQDLKERVVSNHLALRLGMQSYIKSFLR